MISSSPVLLPLELRKPCWHTQNGRSSSFSSAEVFPDSLLRYDPIQKYGPQDCVASINAIVEKIDFLIKQNDTVAIQKLKDIFGLGALEDLRDFAMTIAFPRKFPQPKLVASRQD